MIRRKFVRDVFGKVRLSVAPLLSGVVLFQVSGTDSLRADPGKSRRPPRIDVESILDRLEKRLVEDQDNRLTFEERAKKSSIDKKRASSSTRYNFSKDGGVTDQMNSNDDAIGQISEIAAKLDGQIESLEGDLQKARLKVLEDARVDNFIDIKAQFSAPENVSLRRLTVKIDGITVYSIKDPAGLWLTAENIPLYAGPLPPGTHKLFVDAAIGTKELSAVPVYGDSSRTISREFEIRIPDGKEKRSVALVINGPKTVGGDGSISITDANEEKM